MLDSHAIQFIMTLLNKVAFFSLSQLSSTWWDGSRAGTRKARRRLAELVSAGFLTAYDIVCFPVPSGIKRPICTIDPGDPLPDPAQICSHLKKRYAALTPEPTTIYCATPLAARRLGGCGTMRLTRSMQFSHSLALSQVYLELLISDPKAAHDWVSEHTLSTAMPDLPCLPDAALFHSGMPYRFIEWGGPSYGPERILQLLSLFEETITGEIW